MGQAVSAATSAGSAAKRPAPQPKISARRKRTRQPRSAAIVLTLAAEKGITYAGVLIEAKERIKLEDHGLTQLRYRIAQTGEDRSSKTDRLAAEIRAALADKGLTVSRPERTADIRLVGLESVTVSDVEAVIRRTTLCTGPIKLGSIKGSPSGLGAIWVRCPMATANRLAAAGRLLVGWTSARVHFLAPRPLQCFRCLERSHTAQRCTAECDRSELCYRCGEPGHTAAKCEGKLNCPVCRDQGRGRPTAAAVPRVRHHRGKEEA